MDKWCPNIIGDRWHVPDGNGAYYTIAEKFTYCPCHGTHRPQPKSLAEKFHEYMETFSTHIKVKHYHEKECQTSDEQVFHKEQFSFVSEKLADIATEHFKGDK